MDDEGRRRLRNHGGGLYASEDIAVRRVSRRRWEAGTNKGSFSAYNEPSVDSYDFNPQQFRSLREAQGAAEAGAKKRKPFHDRKGY